MLVRAISLSTLAALATLAAGCAAPAPAPEAPAIPAPETVAGWRMVDLSHGYGGGTLYPDYRASAADIEAWEARNGRIPAGVAVLFRTGWATRWPDAMAYLGDDTPGDASSLHFPGLGADAMRALVERDVGLVGIDTASTDHGPSTDFIVHQIGAAAGIPNLENLADLSALPESGFLLAALPMKIEGGSGAPVRVVALIPPE